MTNKEYFDLVVYNAYEDEDFVRLNLQLCKEEKKSQNNNRPLLFIYINHCYLMNSAINLCIYDYYDFKQLILNIKEKYKSFSEFKKYCPNQLRFVYNKITHSYENTWPNEFLPFKYIENDLIISQILKHFIDWEILQCNFPEIYDYIFYEKYPLPNDYDIPVQSIAAYVYMLEHNFTLYPRTVVYNKYSKFHNSIQGFYKFDSNDEKNSKDGKKYINDKRKQTTFEHFGVDWSMQSEEVKEKSRQTCLERYGTENAFQNEGIKHKQQQTCLERYGHKHPAQSEEIKEKMHQTFLKHYGYEHVLQNEAIKEKAYQTKCKNKTVNSSKPEEDIFNILFSLYGSHVKHHYKEQRYNYACDFYIDLLDMFIEQQGTWYHGKHIFNPENDSDIQLLNKWKQKVSDGHPAYKDAIYVWTERDPLKRQTAKENNLNYFELWTLKEALSFIDELPILTSI